LTCVGDSKDEIRDILANYRKVGIENIMTLRGDPPAGESSFLPVKNGFKNAGELVAFIKREFPEMGIGVAGFPEGHPECPNRLNELDYLKRKVDEGADYICTQLFFNNSDFYDFRERCTRLGINIPIIAGLMPISSISGMKRMADLALGARIPAKLLRSLDRAEGDEGVSSVGVHWATEQARDLLDNEVRGIHFYTLNRSLATRKIYENLGISSGQSLQNS
jgi:methylenetetrahydrofolate reductase (NADPH)